jgi:iron complex outermembrane receptor protein
LCVFRAPLHPLTTAEGESTIEDIDWRLSVVSKSLRTHSTSFGSGLGGVINLFAREILSTDEFQANQTTYAFGLLKQNFFSELW